jgi:hypothetical protein
MKMVTPNGKFFSVQLAVPPLLNVTTNLTASADDSHSNAATAEN